MAALGSVPGGEPVEMEMVALAAGGAGVPGGVGGAGEVVSLGRKVFDDITHNYEGVAFQGHGQAMAVTTFWRLTTSDEKVAAVQELGVKLLGRITMSDTGEVLSPTPINDPGVVMAILEETYQTLKRQGKIKESDRFARVLNMVALKIEAQGYGPEYARAERTPGLRGILNPFTYGGMPMSPA